MNTFVGSIALIRHPEQLEQLWLAHWNGLREQFEFVTAERLEEESFRECLDREIAWNLRLRRGKDYLMSSMARLHLDIPVQLPKLQHETQFVVEFYVVDLYGRQGRTAIEENTQAHWLTSQEVLSGQSKDGRRIDPTLVTLLNKADVIARHSG